jgi:hypothetical protein
MPDVSCSMPLTPEIVGPALWEVNKAAKRHRDAARAAFDAQNSSRAHYHIRKREMYYEVKDQVVFAAILQNWATLVAVHKISGCNFRSVNYSRLLLCIDIAGFQFHCDIPGMHDLEGHAIVELPPNWQSAAAPEGTHMSLADARTILKAFVAASEVDDETEIAIDGIVLRRAYVTVRDNLSLEEQTELRLSLDELEQTLNQIEDEHATCDDEVDDEQLTAFEQQAAELDGWVCELLNERVFSPDLAQRIRCLEKRISDLNAIFSLNSQTEG